MLPHPTDPTFHVLLMAKRESLGLLRSELSKKSDICPKLIRRYEEKGYKYFSVPKLKNWLILNIVLGYEIPNDSFNETLSELPLAIKAMMKSSNKTVSDFFLKERFKNSIKPIEKENISTNWLPCSPYYIAPAM